MKKLLSTVLIATTLTTAASAAGTTGVGFAEDMGFGVTAQFNGNINATIGNAGVAGDYLFLGDKIDADIGDKLSWYVGGGVAYFWSDWTAKAGAIDVRVPVGLDLDFAKQWDVYLQAIPSLRIIDGLGFGINGAIGVRYFF